MGLYSTIRTLLRCGQCGHEGEVEVQFKYGNLWAHEYTVGDAIIWGRTQVGDSSEVLVAAIGIAGCPTCDQDVYFDVLIDCGRIRSVQSSSGKYDYHHGEGDYVILSED